MAFEFPYETLLSHRKLVEEAAQKEYAEARAAVTTKLKLISDMYAQIEKARDDVDRMQIAGKTNGQQIAKLLEFVDGQKILIERQREEARELMAVAEEKHDHLIHSAREVKVLEKLKEKRQGEYLLRRKKKVEKLVDEMNTMRFQRGRK